MFAVANQWVQAMKFDTIKVMLGLNINALIEAGKAKLVASDLRFGEGPAYLNETDSWIFSDIPNDRVLHFSERTGLSVAASPSQFANGHCPMPGGGFLNCEHLSRSVTRTYLDGSTVTICDSFEGKRLNSPNDVIVARDGAIWFSDPTYGILSDLEGRRADPEQDRNRVYRVAPDGTTTAEIETLGMPNGLAFSPDESLLYVVDSAADSGPDIPFNKDAGRDVLAFPIGSNGRVAGPGQPIFRAKVGIPDGLRVDGDGRLWVATGEGVTCLDPDGTVRGVIYTPHVASNLAFGGAQSDRMLITTEKCAYLLFC
jgi:gluconolactonase